MPTSLFSNTKGTGESSGRGSIQPREHGGKEEGPPEQGSGVGHSGITRAYDIERADGKASGGKRSKA